MNTFLDLKKQRIKCDNKYSSIKAGLFVKGHVDKYCQNIRKSYSNLK